MVSLFTDSRATNKNLMKKRSLVTLCLLAWCSLLLDSRADVKRLEPLQLEVPEAALKNETVLWCGVYVSGAKAGWASETRAPGMVEGTAGVTVSLQMAMEIKALDNPMKVEMITRTHYSATPPHRALLIEETQRMMKQERKLVLRHKEGGTYAVELTEAGKTKKQEASGIERYLWQVTSPERWASDPARKPGDSVAVVEFSSEKLKTSLQSLTLVRATDWAGPGGKLGIWEADFLDQDEGLKGVVRLSRLDGTMVNAHFGPSIEMRVEPEAIAKSTPKGGAPDLFTAMSIAADRPLADSPSLAELVIELIAPEGVALPELPNTINQTVEKISPSKLNVRITPGKGNAQPATEAERMESLKATQRYPIDEPVIQKLAAGAVEGAKTDVEKVKKLLAFTDYYIRDTMETEPLTVMDLIKTRRGDCSAHSLLFTTLARAAGIPSREASGWMYMGNTYKTFGGHAWNEVVLDGQWVPVDPLWGQMQLDAGHIHQQSGQLSGAVLQNMITGLKARVISFQKK